MALKFISCYLTAPETNVEATPALTVPPISVIYSNGPMPDTICIQSLMLDCVNRHLARKGRDNLNRVEEQSLYTCLRDYTDMFQTSIARRRSNSTPDMLSNFHVRGVQRKRIAVSGMSSKGIES
jgi:hypothetical protein